MGNRHGTTYQTKIVITTTFKILKPSKMVVLKYTEGVVSSIVFRSLPSFCYGGRMEI